MSERIVIALGGNAISKPGLRGTIQEQFYATLESMEHIAELMINGFDNILISHGNGPQVGAAILRSEIASQSVYPLPMDICVADTQGGMGYMIEQVLSNHLRKRGMKNPIASIVTRTMIDVHDPAFTNPTKPIGRFYSEDQARELMAGKGWHMKEDSGRGWRRLVASPKPIRILESDSIKLLIDHGHTVIAGGGGGVPVGLNRHNTFYGSEAVIDKDLTSAVLAHDINASILIILTGVEYVYTGFGTNKQHALTRIRANEIEQYLTNDEFDEGSMKPKIEAALTFLKNGGQKVIITSISKCLAALRGKTGTHIES